MNERGEGGAGGLRSTAPSNEIHSAWGRRRCEPMAAASGRRKQEMVLGSTRGADFEVGVNPDP